MDHDLSLARSHLTHLISPCNPFPLLQNCSIPETEPPTTSPTATVLPTLSPTYCGPGYFEVKLVTQHCHHCHNCHHCATTATVDFTAVDTTITTTTTATTATTTTTTAATTTRRIKGVRYAPKADSTDLTAQVFVRCVAPARSPLKRALCLASCVLGKFGG